MHDTRNASAEYSIHRKDKGEDRGCDLCVPLVCLAVDFVRIAIRNLLLSLSRSHGPYLPDPLFLVVSCSGALALFKKSRRGRSWFDWCGHNFPRDYLVPRSRGSYLFDPLFLRANLPNLLFFHIDCSRHQSYLAYHTRTTYMHFGLRVLRTLYSTYRSLPLATLGYFNLPTQCLGRCRVSIVIIPREGLGNRELHVHILDNTSMMAMPSPNLMLSLHNVFALASTRG